tara:strand:+ start:300 stop:1313 length:1014 start_codon:yes stop_codon:yes gene_type:complete
MNHLDKKIRAFIKLGKYLKEEKIDSQLENLIIETEKNNKWFTNKNTLKALKVWGDTLTKKNILKWLTKYSFNNEKIKKIGIVMAGNIPIVGFHDLMCVLFTKHIAIVKTSSSDPFLIPFLYNKLVYFEPELRKRVVFKDKIDFVDALIATGNNITIRNISDKFNSYPCILRGARNSIAVLNGNESTKDLKLLSEDILRYYGFGCRSVTKIYVPNNYNFTLLKKILSEKSKLITLNEYLNNFKKNKAINEIIKSKFHIAGKLILIEDKNINAEISSVNYEYYDNKDSLINKINSNHNIIQCMVGNISENKFIKFGEAQKPNLWSYADNIDTIEFLLSL